MPRKKNKTKKSSNYNHDIYESIYSTSHQKRSLTAKEETNILWKPHQADWRFLLHYRILSDKVMNVCPKIELIRHNIMIGNITEKDILENISVCLEKQNRYIFHKIIKHVFPLSEEFISKYINYINPFDIIDYKGKTLSESFYDKHYKYFNEYLWELYTIRQFSEEFLLKYINDDSVLNKTSKIFIGPNAWVTISKEQILPNSLLCKYEKYIHWKEASLIQNISISQYRKFYKSIDWHIISRRPDISIEVLDEFAEYIIWEFLLNQHTYIFDELFIIKHGTKSYWDWNALLLHYSHPLSDELIIWAGESPKQYIDFYTLSCRQLSDQIVERYYDRLLWSVLVDTKQKISSKMLDKYAYLIDEQELWNYALSDNKFHTSTLDRYMDKFSEEQIMQIAKFQILDNNFMNKYYHLFDLNIILFTQIIDYHFIQEHNLEEFIKTTFDSIIISVQYNSKSNYSDNYDAKHLCSVCNHYHHEGTRCNICNHVRKINSRISFNDADIHHTATSTKLPNCRLPNCTLPETDYSFSSMKFYVYIPEYDCDIETNNYFKYLLYMQDQNGNPYEKFIGCRKFRTKTINKQINNSFAKLHNFIQDIILIQQWWTDILYRPNGLMYNKSLNSYKTALQNL